MLYEIFWLIFAVTVAILMSVGLLGFTLSASLSSRPTKIAAAILSVLIFLAGVSFSYQWYAQRKEIQNLSGQIEQAIKVYLEKQKKGP